MNWLRSLIHALGNVACRLLTLLDNGADDCWDRHADDAVEQAVAEK